MDMRNIKVLSKLGLGVNSGNSLEKNLLILASQEGNNSLVRELLTSGMDVNIKDSNGYTALMDAAFNGHEVIIKELLSRRGISINLQDNYGFTALMHAACGGHEVIIKELLSRRGISINLQDANGYTALMHAVCNGHEVVAQQLLRKKQISINLQDNYGFTALMYAVFSKHRSIFNELLMHPSINVNVQDSMGYTALVHSIYDYDSVFMLVSANNMQVNTQDNKGCTALMHGSFIGNASFVNILLSIKDIQINLQDVYGYTALMYAVSKGHIPVIKHLFTSSEIDANMENKLGKTALDLLDFTSDHSSEILEIFLQKGVITRTKIPDNIITNVLLRLTQKQDKTTIEHAASLGYILDYSIWEGNSICASIEEDLEVLAVPAENFAPIVALSAPASDPENLNLEHDRRILGKGPRIA